MKNEKFKMKNSKIFNLIYIFFNFQKRDIANKILLKSNLTKKKN
jgi:hypothetical protein